MKTEVIDWGGGAELLPIALVFLVVCGGWGVFESGLRLTSRGVAVFCIRRGCGVPSMALTDCSYNVLSQMFVAIFVCYRFFVPVSAFCGFLLLGLTVALCL